MDCNCVRDEGVVERHLRGALSADEQQAFEEHLLVCPRCQEACRLHLALEAAFAETTAKKSGRAWTPFWWRWAAAAGVALVIVAVGVALWLRPPAVSPTAPGSTGAPARRAAGEPPPAAASSPAPAGEPSIATKGAAASLRELGRVEPPAYAPTVLRGAEGEAQRRFQEAMRAYVRGEFSTAARRLQQAAKSDPQAPEIGFYLGACFLCTDHNEAAIAELQRTIALGRTPLLEKSRFYLAKAYLRAGDLEAAHEELKNVAGLDGEFAEAARKLLSELERIRESPS